jgi:hypothetical protein
MERSLFGRSGAAATRSLLGELELLNAVPELKCARVINALAELDLRFFAEQAVS